MPDTTTPPSEGRPGRIDYYDDPNAPKATTIVLSVNVVVENGKGEILLIRRADNNNWALPGGAIDIGESLTQAAIREVQEETGITCKITGLVGIYTHPKHLIHYTSNDEVRQEFSIVLIAQAAFGRPQSSTESSEIAWAVRSAAASYNMHPTMRRRLEDYLGDPASRYSPSLRSLLFVATAQALSGGRGGTVPGSRPGCPVALLSATSATDPRHVTR